FGKIIGGGLPVGAFAGRAEIMDCLAPEGSVYQAGTLSGNPLAMAAGYTLLKELNENPDIYKSLEEKTAYLEKGMQKVFENQDIPHQINRKGSMISIHFTSESVKDFESAVKGNNATFKKFFHGMLKEGIHIPPSAFETWFISYALTYKDLDDTISACEKIAKQLD